MTMAIFEELSTNDKIAYTKREFIAVVRRVFENPEALKSFVVDKKISNDQSKIILTAVNNLNSKTCACCRQFSNDKLKLSPIEKELLPLLDIAQANVKGKAY